MHRVHAPGADSSPVELSDTEAHHVTRVLRLRAGDDVIVFDGRGREWLGRIARAGRSAVAVDLLERRTPTPEPSVFVTVAIGLLKGGEMDGVVRDVTALGAARVAPFVSSHVAVPERARQARSIARWSRVAVAAAKQSGRGVVPVIEPVTTLETILEAHAADLIVLCAEPRLAVPPGADLVRADRVVVLVGPEGGWADAEVDAILRAGGQALDLGPWTLRADIAPVAALSALWARWGFSARR